MTQAPASVRRYRSWFYHRAYGRVYVELVARTDWGSDYIARSLVHMLRTRMGPELWAAIGREMICQGVAA